MTRRQKASLIEVAGTVLALVVLAVGALLVPYACATGLAGLAGFWAGLGASMAVLLTALYIGDSVRYR